MFCKEYAESGNARRSASRAFKGRYKNSYIQGTFTCKLLKRKEILDKIAQIRQKFLDKHEDIGEEILTRAKMADDNNCHHLYQIAVNIMGIEAPKKSERKDEKVFSIPSHQAPQIDADITVLPEEVKELEEGNKEEQEDTKEDSKEEAKIDNV